MGTCVTALQVYVLHKHEYTYYDVTSTKITLLQVHLLYCYLYVHYELQVNMV